MIERPFDAEPPADALRRRGWEGEKQVDFYLRREFEAAADVWVFHGLRFRTPRVSDESDFTQIDHLVLHRHGMVVVESKATGEGQGEFGVDALGQWTSRSGPQGRLVNVSSPVEQAERQAMSLRRLLEDAQPPLLNKMAGLVQKRFGGFPIRCFVALADKSWLSGRGAGKHADVMKAEGITKAIREEIAAHKQGASWLGVLAGQNADKGDFTLADDEVGRIREYLLRSHLPTNWSKVKPPNGHMQTRSRGAEPREPSSHNPSGAAANKNLGPNVGALATSRTEAEEALTCSHCRSIRVDVVHRRDYCLLCDECGKYTALDWTCRKCGKPATVRTRRGKYFRACDKAGGCGAEVVFFRKDGREGG